MKKSLVLLAMFCATSLMVDLSVAAPRGGGGGGARGGAGGAGGGRPGGAGGFGGGAGGFNGGDRGGGDRAGGGDRPGGDPRGAGGFGGADGGRGFDNRGANPGDAGNRNRFDSLNGGDRPTSQNLNDFLNKGTDANAARDRANDPRNNNVDVRNNDVRNNNIDQRNVYANNNPQWTRNVQNNVQANVNVAARNAFTPQWYNDHPGGWNGYPHANAYAAATWASAASWLAIGAAPVAYYPSGSSTVYNDNSTTVNTTSDSQYAVAPDQTEQAQVASQLAQSGKVDGQTQSSDWMPLGVFALVPGQEKSSNQLVQLQVSKSGTLAGSYLDMLSNSTQPVQGAVDKSSQRAAWSIGSNSQVVFDTTLSSLTQDSAPLTVRFGDNSQQTWTLVRMPDQK